MTMKAIARLVTNRLAGLRPAWARRGCVGLGFLLIHGALWGATNYTFPGAMPAGCSGSGGTYTCGALTLEYGDTITIASPKPATITVNGALNTNRSTINSAGAPSDLTLVITGALATDYLAILNANVIAASIDEPQAQVTFGGSITATSGAILLKSRTTVGGSVNSTGSGAISTESGVAIAGSVTSTSGAIFLGNLNTVGGSVESTIGAITVDTFAVISGNVTSTSGAISINYKAKVVGSINTSSGGVILANESQIGGGINGDTGNVSVGYKASVGGAIKTTTGAVQLAESSVASACVRSTGSASITLATGAVVNSVCCGSSCTTSCVINNSNYPMPPVCTLTVGASSFDCLETGLNVPWVSSARKPLYTKLANTGFKFDVAALKSDGTLESNYVAAGGNTKYLKVELFDDTAPPASCAAYSSAVAAQTVGFSSGAVSGEAGRVLSGEFTVTDAYQKVRCRVKECIDSTCASFSALAPACSSDRFSVRPSAPVLLTTASAVPASPLSTQTPTVKAGATFTLAATTSAGTNYAGTLTQDAGKFTAQTTSQDASQQAGGVVGPLTPTTLTANAAAVSATYSEVGYLYLAPGAYRDASFTDVDSAEGDCVTSTAADGNLSDSLAGGKYGCHIGNKTAVSLGRFVPDHFAVGAGTVAAACTAVTPFSYFGQDGFTTVFTVTAQNVGNVTTGNYAGVFAKFNPANYSSYGFTGATLPAGSVLSSSATAPSGSWSNGVAAVSVKHKVNRPTALTAETSITVSAAPTDGEVPAGTAVAVGTATTLRYGRLRLQNIYGSEKLPLAVPVRAQYWGGNSFVVNADDSCTALGVPVARTLTGSAIPDGAANLYFYPLVANKNQLTSADTAATMTSVLLAGATTLNFTKPGKTGWVDILMDAPDYLKSDWGNCRGQVGTAGLQDDLPCARATFGIYKSPLIYRRENY